MYSGTGPVLSQGDTIRYLVSDYGSFLLGVTSPVFLLNSRLMAFSLLDRLPFNSVQLCKRLSHDLVLVHPFEIYL